MAARGGTGLGAEWACPLGAIVLRVRTVDCGWAMWQAVKRRWKEGRLWIVAVATLLVVYATVAIYMNAKGNAMAEAARSAGLL